MRLIIIYIGPNRNNSSGVDRFMATIIMFFNVFDIYCLRHTRHLVKVTHIIREVWIILQTSNVTLKVTHIYWIKTYQCGEKSPVCFSYEISYKITIARQLFFELEEKLSSNRYLVGNFITEADWRLFTTLVRFDPVYVGHFKCNIRRLKDYPNLSDYVRDLYQVPGVAETVNIEHIKKHYYGSHETINPTRVVPVGPYIDYDEPHSRADLN